MAEVLGPPVAGDATDLVARLLLLYPASRSAPAQPWEGHVLLVVDGHVLALSREEHDAACRHMAGRLDALFPISHGIYDLRNGRFAVLVADHAGLAASLGPLAELIQSHDVDDVAIWLEDLPDDPELLAVFVRGVRTQRAVPAQHPLPSVPAAAPPARRPRVGALAGAGVAMASALVLVGAFLVGGGPATTPADSVAARAPVTDAPGATPGTVGAAALEELGYEVVEESAGAEGTPMILLAPVSDPAPASAGSPGADDIAASGTPSPSLPALPDAAVIAFGATPDEAVGLVEATARPFVVFVGVPTPSDLPAELLVIVAVRGTATPELCTFLQAVPDAQVVGDPVSCDLDIPADPLAGLPDA